MLIIICGLPGSGKTTLAKGIARRFHADYFSSDITRKNRIAKPRYSEEERMSVYDEMAGSVKRALEERKDIVVDATFYKKGIRSRFLELANAAGTESFIVLCVLPEAEVKKRMQNRKNGPSDADFGVYLKLRESFEPIDTKYVVVESLLPLKERIKKIEDFIGERNG